VKKTLSVIIFLSLVACSGSPVVVKLPLPVRPDLPVIIGAELQCLSNDAYDRLRKRDILQDGHILKLEAIIRTTH